MKPTIELLITDLDNTLYDWFDFWYHSFTAMLDQIVAISGIPREKLEPEIKKIYEKHGTSEYSFLIEELEPLLAEALFNRGLLWARSRRFDAASYVLQPAH